MHKILALTLAITSGCIFGGSTADDSPDMALPDQGVPDAAARDDGATNVGLPPDVGGPDLPSPPDATMGPDVGSPTNWDQPDYDKRMLVSWNRSGAAVQNLVVPIRLPQPPDGGNVNAVAVWPGGQVLVAEQDGSTLWVRVPDFGASGEFWVYFDGPASTFAAGDVWPEYDGVWHFSGSPPGRDSSGKGNTMNGVAQMLDLGVVGASARMANAQGQQNTLSTALDLSEGDYTVELWVALTGDQLQTSTNKIFDTLVAGERRVSLRWINPRDIQMHISDGEQAEEFRTAYPEMPTHLAVVVRNADQQVNLFVNGQLVQQIDFPDPQWRPDAQLARFGSAWTGGGFIDEVRIRFGARSPDYFAALVGAYRGDIFTYSTVQQQR